MELRNTSSAVSSLLSTECTVAPIVTFSKFNFSWGRILLLCLSFTSVNNTKWLQLGPARAVWPVRQDTVLMTAMLLLPLVYGQHGRLYSGRHR